MSSPEAIPMKCFRLGPIESKCGYGRCLTVCLARITANRCTSMNGPGNRSIRTTVIMQTKNRLPVQDENRFVHCCYSQPETHEKFVWIFWLTEYHINQAIRTVAAFAANSDIHFDSEDAEVMTRFLRKFLVYVIKSKQGGMPDGGLANGTDSET